MYEFIFKILLKHLKLADAAVQNNKFLIADIFFFVQFHSLPVTHSSFISFCEKKIIFIFTALSNCCEQVTMSKNLAGMSLI
jgi:hypothetical protein